MRDKLFSIRRFLAKPRKNALGAALLVLILGFLGGAFLSPKDTYPLVALVVLMAALSTYLLVERGERLRLNIAEKTQALNDTIHELEKSRESLQKVIEQSPLPIMITDNQGGTEYCNRRFTEIFGYTLDDVRTADEWWQAAYPDENYRLRVKRVWNAAIEDAAGKGRQTEPQEWDIACKDGAVKRVLFNVMTLDKGSIIIMTDITERKKEEEDLRQNAFRLRNYFDQEFLGMAITSAEKVWVEVNDTLCRMLGYSREELTKLTWAEITHPEDLDENLRFYNQTLAGEIESYSLEKRFVRKDGSIFHAELSVSALRKDDGSLEYMLTIINDITERKKAEEEIKASHERMLILLDSIPAEIHVADMQSHEILFANEYMRKNYGRELVGKVCYQVFQDEEEQCPICPYDRLLDKKGNPVEGIIWEDQNPVSKKWYVNYDRAVPWVDGRLAHVQIAIDITERKAAEEALKTLNIKLDGRVVERTKDLHETISTMADREIRMVELKKVITQLRTQLKEAGLEPVAHDPLLGPDEEW